MATAVLIDGRNYLDAESSRAAGFAYEGIGRPDGQNGESRCRRSSSSAGKAPAFIR